MERVSFIHTESGDVDYIVSFALDCGLEGGVKSLTLLRTPPYETFLEPAERGVHVSLECDAQEDYLVAFEFDDLQRQVRIKTRQRHFILDVNRVEDEELTRMKRLLRLMNFDQHFTLKLTGPSEPALVPGSRHPGFHPGLKPESMLADDAMLEVIQNQIDQENPPETAATLARLLAQGLPRQEAMKMLARVLAAEIFDMQKSGQPYDAVRYISRLQQLPNLSFLDE